MLDWKTYLGEVKSRISVIAKLQLDLVKGYRLISESKLQNPTLDPKTRELIALAVATRCDGYVSVHVEAAKKHVATREEFWKRLRFQLESTQGPHRQEQWMPMTISPLKGIYV